MCDGLELTVNTYKISSGLVIQYKDKALLKIKIARQYTVHQEK